MTISIRLFSNVRLKHEMSNSSIANYIQTAAMRCASVRASVDVLAYVFRSKTTTGRRLNGSVMGIPNAQTLAHTELPTDSLFDE